MFSDNNFSNIFKNSLFNSIEFKTKQLKEKHCFIFFKNLDGKTARDLYRIYKLKVFTKSKFKLI